MYRRTAGLVATTALWDDLLGALSGTPPVAALLDDCEVRLFTNVINPSPTSVVGDFDGATFAGYAAQTLATWVGPVPMLPTGRALIAQANFLGGAIVDPGEVIQGYYITTTAAAALLAAERFTDPVPFAAAGDFLSLDLIVNLVQNLIAAPAG